MAQPNSSQVHLDQILTNISVAYLQDQTRFVATQVFPRVPVDKQSDKYYIFDKNALLRDTMQKRAPSTESAGGGYTLSRDSYFCDVFALHKDISNQDRANTDNPLNQDRNATQYLTQQALLRQEVQFNTDYMGTSIWGTDVVGGTDFTQWSDYSGSNPIDDVEAGKEKVNSVTGYDPNTLVMGYRVWRKIKNHPDVIDRIKYVGGMSVTTDTFARLCEVDRVLVAKAIKNAAIEGETDTYDFILGKDALLCYSAPEPGLEMPSAGYTMEWTGVSEGLGLPVGMSTFYIPTKKTDRVEIERAWDNKVVGTDLGYFLHNVVV